MATDYPVCSDYHEEYEPQEGGSGEGDFIIWVKQKSGKNLEELTNPCPLLASETAPCRYTEDRCYTSANDFHKCTYYRRHVRQILIEEMRASERARYENRLG